MTLSYSLYLIFSNRDLKQYSTFYEQLIEQIRLKIGQNQLKRHKEVGLYKRLVCSQNIKARNLVLEQIPQIQKEIMHSDYKYLEQACQFIQLSIYSVLGQIYQNYNNSMDIVNSSLNQLRYNQTYDLYMEDNQIIRQFFEELKEKVKNGSEIEQKNIQYFYVKICQNL